MYYFGKASREKLKLAHPDIQLIMIEAIKIINITVIQTVRTPEEHAKYLELGTTTVSYDKTKHGKTPAEAIDIAPWFKKSPHIRWEDKNTFLYLAGIIMGTAYKLNIPLKWGGNWDMDEDILTDQRLQDLGHFELLKRR